MINLIIKTEDPHRHINIPSHCCYLLYSPSTHRTYIGYTVNPTRRLRQHNQEITGGAKKTKRGYPWVLICVISGFLDHGSALRFEYHWQHPPKNMTGWSLGKKLRVLPYLVNRGDYPLKNWGLLTIYWFVIRYYMDIPEVTDIIPGGNDHSLKN